MKDNLILRNAKQKICAFNKIGLHYNLIAKEVYERRRSCDPFSQSFTQHIIAALIAFDIGRMMGKVEEAYDFEGKGFGSRLNLKLGRIRQNLKGLMSLSLTEIDLHTHKQDILKAYRELSGGEGALNKHGHFYVGATKILHFLNPELFIIVDSHAAEAFLKVHGIKPGYSSQKYWHCMAFAQKDIQTYGLERFKAHDPGTPITTIYDKLTFMTGKYLKEANREDKN
jgi:hypothetical protein